MILVKLVKASTGESRLAWLNERPLKGEMIRWPDERALLVDKIVHPVFEIEEEVSLLSLVCVLKEVTHDID